VATNEQAMVRHINGKAGGFLTRGDWPSVHYGMGFGIYGHELIFVLEIVIDPTPLSIHSR